MSIACMSFPQCRRRLPTSMAPPAKRARTSDLRIECGSGAQLASIVHAVTALSQRIHLRVSPQLVQTQAVSSGKSCMVSAKLDCITHNVESEVCLCVDSHVLLKTLRSVIKGHLVDLVHSGDRLHVCTRDEQSHAGTMVWKLPLLADDSFSVQLDDIEYDGEWVYDTTVLRSDLRRCRDMNGADALSLRLLESDDHRCVELSASGDNGDVCIRHVSRTEVDGDDDTATVCASPHPLDDTTLRPVFAQQYCITYISDFLKAVDQPSVRLLLGNEQPLIVEVGLGTERSQLTFVQGPHAD